MSEIGEIFSLLKEESQRKRARNRASSAKLLKSAGFEFVSKNDGAHLIVTGSKSLIDFWPGTGKWIDRAGRHGRGVRPLLNHLRANKT